MKIEEKIAGFVAGAQAKIEADNARAGYKNDRVLVAKYGKKYARIEQREKADAECGSAWAFIDLETGAILKPAGWKSPAKGSRGNINTPTFGVEYVGPYGPAYLR